MCACYVNNKVQLQIGFKKQIQYGEYIKAEIVCKFRFSAHLAARRCFNCRHLSTDFLAFRSVAQNIGI